MLEESGVNVTCDCTDGLCIEKTCEDVYELSDPEDNNSKVPFTDDADIQLF
jgi:hypothetical protein